MKLRNFLIASGVALFAAQSFAAPQGEVSRQDAPWTLSVLKSMHARRQSGANGVTTWWVDSLRCNERIGNRRYHCNAVYPSSGPASTEVLSIVDSNTARRLYQVVQSVVRIGEGNGTFNWVKARQIWCHEKVNAPTRCFLSY